MRVPGARNHVEHDRRGVFDTRFRLCRLYRELSGAVPAGLRFIETSLRLTRMASFPTHARAVIIGGGIVGCSTAYHLAKLGWKDVVIIERHKLTSGSTHHAAGLVGQLRSSANVTQLLGHSVALYNSLEAETGLASGWQMNGGLRLACNEARWIELKRQATSARSFGLEMQLLTPREAQQLWPLMDISDLVGAAFLPTDGQVNPSDITQSLARGARMRGVRIYEDTTLLAIEL